MEAKARRKKLKDEIIIACGDLDLDWTGEEELKAIRLYNRGISYKGMARELRPYKALRDSLDEVAIFIIHLARQGKIEPRGFY